MLLTSMHVHNILTARINEMYNVLVVDFSPYRDDITSLFRNNGYEVAVCENAFEAMSKLRAYDFDLVVSEVELPGDNAFDLYNYLNKNYPYIPAIMTTDKNIDAFFDKIFNEGIGNVLKKPLKESEVLNLSQKLITKNNIFNITNYLKDAVDTKRIRIQGSRQIQKAIAAVIRQINEWGFPISNKMALTLVLNELAINAVYHSHGLTLEKEERRPVQLGENEYVDIHFSHNDGEYAISITDYKGRLSKMKILDSINRVIVQENLITKASETGEDISDFVTETGRGIDLVRKLSGEYYFIIKKDVKTEIILIFSREAAAAAKMQNNSSLKIIEDNSEA